MPPLANTGTVMMCSFGVAPSSLIALQAPTTMAGGPPAATIMDHKPIANIPPFGMCLSLANPMVASATAVADRRDRSRAAPTPGPVDLAVPS